MSQHLGQMVLALQAANLAVTASTTLVNSDLTIPIAVSQRMRGRIVCPITLAGTASGAKWQLVVPAGGTLYQVAYQIINGNGTGTLAGADILLASAAFSNALANATDHYMVADFEIHNGSTAGSVTLQFAQLVSDAGAATLLAGATMQVTKF